MGRTLNDFRKARSFAGFCSSATVFEIGLAANLGESYLNSFFFLEEVLVKKLINFSPNGTETFLNPNDANHLLISLHSNHSILQISLSMRTFLHGHRAHRLSESDFRLYEPRKLKKTPSNLI